MTGKSQMIDMSKFEVETRISNAETNEDVKPLLALSGMRIKSVDGLKKNSEETLIVFESGCALYMTHTQECCEMVRLVESSGLDAMELLGSVFAGVEISSSSRRDDSGEGRTDTWISLLTSKGSTQLRWLGESNGYYSESIDFVALRPRAQAND